MVFWILHELSSRQLQLRVDACMELMMSHWNYRWLHNLIAGDERWMLYVDHTRKRQWLRDWTNCCSNALELTLPNEDCAERLAGCQRNYSLGNSSCWPYHHC